MIQKINLNNGSTMRGLGRVDDTHIINLQEYVIPLHRRPVMGILKRVKISKKIGKTVYDVTANFNLEGKETILQQFKDLILSTELK